MPHILENQSVYQVLFSVAVLQNDLTGCFYVTPILGVSYVSLVQVFYRKRVTSQRLQSRYGMLP